MRLFVLMCVVTARLASADVQAQLAKARAAMQDLDYAGANKTLEAARKEPNASRGDTLQLLELQGITLASLGQEAKALKVFQTLLSLEPEFKLPGNQPPRVTTVFFEARGWVGQAKPMAAKASANVGEAGVKALTVEITNDPLKLAREVRFVTVVDGTARPTDVALVASKASLTVEAPRVEWFAVVLGERKGGLLELQSASAPMTDGINPTDPLPFPKGSVGSSDPAPQPPPRADPVPSPPVTVEAPAPAARPMSGLRLAGIGVGAAGVVAAGVGTVFGVMAQSTSAKVANAERDASGRIIGLTRVEGLALDEQQRTQALLANTLWIAGGAMAATGVALFFLGQDAGEVTVIPMGSGITVTGRF